MTALLRTLKRRERYLIMGIDRSRRTWLLLRIRWLAAWHRTHVELDVAPDLRLGRRITVKIAPRSRLSISIAPHCRIGDDVILTLAAGSIRWGEDVQLRVRSAVNLSGELRCDGSNIFSYGTIIHCATSIHVGALTAFGEYVTLVDSAHHHTSPDVPTTENTLSGPILIGRNVFVAPGASVGRGVTIGDYAVVGPNSVVVKDVASRTFVSGVPAELVRVLDLPWEEGA